MTNSIYLDYVNKSCVYAPTPVVSQVRTLTPPVRGYSVFWRTMLDSQRAVFRVRACNDAHVALSEGLGNTQIRTTEIVIGGWANTRSAIRAGRYEGEGEGWGRGGSVAWFAGLR